MNIIAPTEITCVAIAVSFVVILSSLGLLAKRVLSVLSARRDANIDLERRLAVEKEKASRIPDLEQSLVEKSSLIDELREERAISDGNLATLARPSGRSKSRQARRETSLHSSSSSLEMRS
jgi:hypothetical protein